MNPNDGRDFLKRAGLALASPLHIGRQPPAAPVPPPKKAPASSVILWTLKGSVAVFHVADAPGRYDPATGEMKWTDLYTAVGKSIYSGYIALEYLPIPIDQAGSLTKAVTSLQSALNAGRPEKPSPGALS
jgi:hypothetical protein